MAMLRQDLNPSRDTSADMTSLDGRAQAILRLIVDSYMQDGEAVGSRTLSKHLATMLGMELSPATIRNAMADLEDAGLLYSAHVSAGRMPTEAGLRLFVNHLMDTQPMDGEWQSRVERELDMDQHHLPAALERASLALSSLSQCAGLVAAPKKDRPFKQVEFVSLSSTRVLVVWVAEDGSVENRIVMVDEAMAPADLHKAAEYLNRHLYGSTLGEMRSRILDDIAARRTEMNELTQRLVTEGLVIPGEESGLLIVRGQARLLNDIRHITDLDRLRKLFDTLEQRETMLKLVEQTGAADGVQIFIGAQNDLFDHSGCAMIVAPYKDKHRQVIGAIGVIGPSRLNYRRIIPIVDYTAKLLSGV